MVKYKNIWISLVIVSLLLGGLYWFFKPIKSNSNEDYDFSCGSVSEVSSKINNATGINLSGYVEKFEKCFLDLTEKGYDSDVEILVRMGNNNFDKFVSKLKLKPFTPFYGSSTVNYTQKDVDEAKAKGEKHVRWTSLDGEYFFLSDLNIYDPKDVSFSNNLLNNIPDFGGTQFRVIQHQDPDNMKLVLIEIRN